MNTKSKKIRNFFLCLGALAVTVGGISLQAADKEAAAPQALPEIKLQPAEPKAAAPAPVIAPETVLVKVNGEEIKQAQVDEIANQMMQQFSKQFGGQMMPGGMPPEILEQARGRALSQLTQKTLIDQALKDMKKEPTEAEIKAEMDRFDAVIKSNNTTDSLANQLAEAKKMEPGLDIEAKFKEDLKNIIQQIALVEKECQIKIDLTDAEVKAKFDKDPSKYNKVRASHILIATKPQQGDAVVVDKEALAKAESVLKEVKEGKDFTELAKKYSDDPGSKDNGGDLDFFTKDKMVPEFADAAFKLKKGETSGLVKSQFGYHIIKVTDIKEGNFENAKAMIFMEDRSEKMKENFPKAMEKISKRAKIEDLRPKTEAPKAPLGGLTPAAPAEEKAEEKKAEEKK